MLSSRGRPGSARLGMERLEDRDTPAYLTTPGANIAIGNVIGGGNGATEIVYGTGSGGGPVVSVFNQAGQQLRSFFAYDQNFRDGVAVATADVDGDGVDEIITAPGPGGGPNVKVFTADGKVLSSFFAYDAGFRGGVSVAAGDLTGDGKAEIVTGPGNGGGPLVRTFSAGGKIQSSIIPTDVTFRGGINVAVGDVNGDGQNDIVTGAGVGGSPLVQSFERTGARIGAFFAFDPNSRTGVSVAAGDTDRGGPDEIWAFRGPGSNSEVRGFTATGTILSIFQAYPDSTGGDLGGVNLAVGDANADTFDDVVTVRATGDYRQAPTVFAGARNLVPQGQNQTLTAGVYGLDANWTYYFPAGFTTARRFPILFAFDPGGNVDSPQFGAYDAQLKSSADRLGFVVATSRYFRSLANGGPADGQSLAFSQNTDGSVNVGSGYRTLITQIRSVLATITNSDQTRVILAGYGEGGSVAHALNIIDPTLADAILADQGPTYGARVIVPGDPNSTFQYGPEFYLYALTNSAQIGATQRGARGRQLFQFITTDTDPLANEVRRDFNQLYPLLGYGGTLWTYTGNPVGEPAPDYSVQLNTLFANPDWITPP